MFAEDLSVMFADFGVSATLGSESARVLFDSQSQMALQGMAMSEECAITLPVVSFPTLASGDAITVDGTAYTVRQVEILDDGAIKRATLKRVA